jgi:outer membrane murein-binding lipoprotein Lpp
MPVAAMTALAGFFSFVPGWLWAALLAGSVLHGCWLGNRRDSAVNDLHTLETQVAEKKALDQEAARIAEHAARAEEARRNAERDKTIQEAKDAQENAQSAAADARAAADGLRARVAALVAAGRPAAGNSQPVGRGSREQDQAALDLLAGLLDRRSGELVDVAEYADRLKIAGLACERQYDGLAAKK